jgi:hypothetical protein
MHRVCGDEIAGGPYLFVCSFQLTFSNLNFLNLPRLGKNFFCVRNGLARIAVKFYQ